MAASPPTAGYSGKPLSQKMGLKPGQRLHAIAPPAHYPELMGAALGEADYRSAPAPDGLEGMADIVHLFVPDRATLERAAHPALAQVAEGGMLWVSWPKKSSRLFRDLTEDGLRDVLLPTGWVDVKVAAVDQDWSGLKFLRRKK